PRPAVGNAAKQRRRNQGASQDCGTSNEKEEDECNVVPRGRRLRRSRSRGIIRCSRTRSCAREKFRGLGHRPILVWRHKRSFSRLLKLLYKPRPCAAVAAV